MKTPCVCLSVLHTRTHHLVCPCHLHSQFEKEKPLRACSGTPGVYRAVSRNDSYPGGTQWQTPRRARVNREAARRFGGGIHSSRRVGPRGAAAGRCPEGEGPGARTGLRFPSFCPGSSSRGTRSVSRGASGLVGLFLCRSLANLVQFQPFVEPLTISP